MIEFIPVLSPFANRPPVRTPINTTNRVTEFASNEQSTTKHHKVSSRFPHGFCFLLPQSGSHLPPLARGNRAFLFVNNTRRTK